MGHLRTALPISGVNGLGKGMEFVEGVGFANTGDLILDAGQKSTIHLSAEGSIAPLDIGSKVVEVNWVLHNVLVLTHLEVFEVSFGLAFRIVGSEVIF